MFRFIGLILLDEESQEVVTKEKPKLGTFAEGRGDKQLIDYKNICIWLM